MSVPPTEEQLSQKPSLSSSFYSILGLELTGGDGAELKEFSEKDIKKAARTKSLLYHPDKLKNNLNEKEKDLAAKMFYLIQLASTTLSDPILKLKYDDLLRAEQMRELRFKEMDQHRQKGKRDLEERERLAQETSKKSRSNTGQSLTPNELLALEKERIKEQGASKVFAIMQQKRQSTARAKYIATTLQNGPTLIKNAPLETCILRVKWTKEAGLVDETRLRNYYTKFGPVSSILMKEGKKSASVVFKDCEGTFNALKMYSATTGASIPPDPHFNHKMMAAEDPEAFTYLALKRDPSLDAAFVGTSSKGFVAGGREEYEKSTLDRMKEQERMRKEILELDEDGA